MMQDNFHTSKGFTLVELLIVMAILAIMFSILLIALNPFEQLSRTNDVTSKEITQDFISASQEYLATQKELPWQANSICKQEFISGNSLAQMPDCTNELTGGGKLQSTYTSSPQLRNIYVNTCGDSAILCYNPKSKIEYEDAHYDKFGVNDPGCPGTSGPSDSCYWCKPLNNDTKCTEPPSPTPKPLPTATPTPIPSPTYTPTPTPTPLCPYKIGSYCLDDTKFLQTYAVLAFTDPGFPAYTTQPDQDGGIDNGWSIDVSFRQDFGGTTVVDGFGYLINGIPVTTSADTDLWATYAGNGNFYADWASNSIKTYQTSLTPKHFAFLSMPFEWSKYVNGCGKTIYWRVVNFRTGIPGVNYDSNKYSPTYTNTIDCTTKVGVEPIGTWGGLPQDDFNKNNIYDYSDYIIGALWTKFRAGGWQPPE